MKIDYITLNPDLEFNKRQIASRISPQTSKLDTKGFNTVIEPIIPVRIAKNLILQNNRLDKCIRILAQDVILNDFTFLNEQDEDYDLPLSFWKENIEEVFKAVQEFYAYGFGALEVGLDKETGMPQKLYQIPAETLFITQEPKRDGTDENSYYAVQKIGSKTTKMKLTRYQYDEEDIDLPLCLWLGSGRTSDFYEVPYWLPAFNSISAKVALDELNAKKINEGNLLSGILTIVRPPKKKGDEDIDVTLEKQMEDAGTGILTLDLQTFNPEIPLNIDYIKISEDNYEYLSTLADKSDQDVLACFSIPKVRLMIDDVTESMNSNKSDTIYEIYTKSLSVEQLPFENEINRFNRRYFKYHGHVDIETPIFSDKKETEINTLLNLFDKGVITLGEVIKGVSVLYPALQLEIDENNPIYHDRYYQGRVLGFDNYNTSELEEIDDVIKWLQS